MKLTTLLSPRELPALSARDLGGTACVVFDVLRATSTFVTALHHGATAIVPVSEISEALARRADWPGALLAGERDGVKIRGAQSGGITFDLGNSPREFTPEIGRGKAIISTTTNGTRALRACAGAGAVLAGSFLNLAATANFLRSAALTEILLICAGTGDGVALEDVLAAGALVDTLLAEKFPLKSLMADDASLVARETCLRLTTDLPTALGASQNGQRLLKIPELAADVAFCAQRDVFPLVAKMDAAGALRKV